MRNIREQVGQAQRRDHLRLARQVGSDDGDQAFGTSKWEQIRFRVHCVTDRADSSWYAGILASLVVGFVVISVVAFCLETIPALEETYQVYWFNLEVLVIGIFTVEFVARIWSSPLSWSEILLDPLNAIDFLSVAPFYVYLCMSAASPVDFFMLRVFRLFRLVQLLKLARYSKIINLIYRALLETKSILVILLLMLFITTVLFGSLMYMAERGVYDEATGCYVRPERPDLGCSPFESVPHSLYWGVTTLTGVGYGDHYPVTSWGKCIAAVAMVTGVLALALPVVLIGVHMSNTMVFLRSEIDSKSNMKVMDEELFQAVTEFDDVCLRIAQLSEECQRLLLGSTACRLKRETGGREEDLTREILSQSKPAQILATRMVQRFLDLKKYVNAVDVNEGHNKTNQV